MTCGMILMVVWASLGLASGNQAEFHRLLENVGRPEALLSRGEVRLRFKLFQQTEDVIKKHNSNPDRAWDMETNQFTVMTSEEKLQHLGLRNESELVESENVPVFTSDGLLGAPDAVDHVALGFVTRPKDQRSCGSCWAFAAVAAFEGAYARATKVLKSFSEKEILDCTYSHRNGCDGGWYQDAWGYIDRTNRLAALVDAPYDYARDRDCRYHNIQNGIKNAHYSNYQTVRRTDNDLRNAAAKAVIAVAMVVESDFFNYGSGIYDGCRSSQFKNVGHAVTLVGYDGSSWKVKNSWGRYWGESGYVRFSRSIPNICKLADYGRFPVVGFMNRGDSDKADSTSSRKREPNHGCAFGDDYPCSDMNCNYGCQSGTCWVQCNGVCGIAGKDRCENCKEWCWVTGDGACTKHEDCFHHRYKSCQSACSL